MPGLFEFFIRFEGFLFHAESFLSVRVSLLSEIHFSTMKDMKSMKGWFAVNPDVSSYSEAIHFLTQRRREISVGEGLFAQWSRHCGICVHLWLIHISKFSIQASLCVLLLLCVRFFIFYISQSLHVFQDIVLTQSFVYPHVSCNIQTFLYLTQRRKGREEISVGESLAVQ
jgi:hypothetical protein